MVGVYLAIAQCFAVSSPREDAHAQTSTRAAHTAKKGTSICRPGALLWVNLCASVAQCTILTTTANHGPPVPTPATPPPPPRAPRWQWH